MEACKCTGTSLQGSGRCVRAQLVGAGEEGLDSEAESADDAETLQPAGLLARPAVTDTLEGIAVQRGDELVCLVLVDKGAATQSLEEGETRLYGVGSGNATTVIRVRANGDVEVSTGGVVRQRVDSSTGVVHLGASSAADFVALATATKTALDKLQAAFDAHVHPTAAVGPPSPPTPVPGVIPVGALGSVAATKAKAT